MFGLRKNKKEDHIVVSPEEGLDAYREVISPDDLEGIAPAKRNLADGMHTPLDEVSGEMGFQEEVVSTPNQFVVDEVAPALMSVEESREVILGEPSLTDLKRREAELEAHFAEKSAVEIQQEQKAHLVARAEKAFELGESPKNWNSMIDEIEQDIRGLQKSAAQVAEREGIALPSQVQQLGGTYQEAGPVVVQEKETYDKIPGVGNTSGISLPGYQPAALEQESLQPVEVAAQTEAPVAEPLNTIEVARAAMEGAYHEARVTEAQSFDELFASLDQIPGFVSSEVGMYALEDLKRIISIVRAGNASINVITRTGGLRNKVWELVNQEMVQEVPLAA